VEAATRQLADQFFDAFARQVDSGATAVAQDEKAGAAPAGARHFSSRVWLAIAAIVAAIVAAYGVFVR
jgi:hypothetical protein